MLLPWFSGQKKQAFLQLLLPAMVDFSIVWAPLSPSLGCLGNKMMGSSRLCPSLGLKGSSRCAVLCLPSRNLCYFTCNVPSCQLCLVEEIGRRVSVPSFWTQKRHFMFKFYNVSFILNPLDAFCRFMSCLHFASFALSPSLYAHTHLFFLNHWK